VLVHGGEDSPAPFRPFFLLDMLYLHARLGAPLLALILLQAPSTAQRDVTSTRGLLQAADADGNGELLPEEWASFLARVGRNEDGTIDRYRVKALILGLDLDHDGAVRANDVDVALSGEDRDGDGRPDGGWLAVILSAVGDTDGDGHLGPEEASALRAEAKKTSGKTGDAIPEALVTRWLQRAEALPPPADRNALTPGVILVGLDALLDADGNGTVSAGDLQAIYTSADANGDGKIDAGELTPAPGRVVRGEERWRVSREDR